MKNTYSLKMEIEKEKGKDTVIKIHGMCPYRMSIPELSGFIECLQEMNQICIDVANERKKNGKIKSKKEQR